MHFDNNCECVLGEFCGWNRYEQAIESEISDFEEKLRDAPYKLFTCGGCVSEAASKAYRRGRFAEPPEWKTLKKMKGGRLCPICCVSHDTDEQWRKHFDTCSPGTYRKYLEWWLPRKQLAKRKIDGDSSVIDSAAAHFRFLCDHGYSGVLQRSKSSVSDVTAENDAKTSPN